MIDAASSTQGIRETVENALGWTEASTCPLQESTRAKEPVIEILRRD